MSWFEKLIPSRIKTEGGNRGNVPKGLWVKCDDCAAVLYRAELERNFNVCPKCGHEEFETDQFRATGGNFAKIFDVQNKRFTTVTCTRCRSRPARKTRWS